MYDELYERIVARCVRDEVTGCLVWQGPTDGKELKGQDPYGRISYRGNKIATHIGVYRAKKGRIPKGKEVDHGCVNSLCCEFTHLVAVTKLKNQRLRVKRSKHKGDVFKCLAIK